MFCTFMTSRIRTLLIDRLLDDTYDTEKTDAILAGAAAAEEADQWDETSDQHKHHRQSVERYQRPDHRHSVEQLPVERRVAVGRVHQHADRYHRQTAYLCTDGPFYTHTYSHV